MKLLHLFCHSRSSIFNIIIFCIVNLFIGISHGFSQISYKTDTVKIGQIFIETDTVNRFKSDTTDLVFNKDGIDFNEEYSRGIPDIEGKTPSFWNSYLVEPTRLALKYELAYKVKTPTEFKKNRFSFRLEYSKLLFNRISLQVDTKISTYLKDDHRTRRSTFWINDYPNEANVAFGGRTPQAYLQTSFQKTSIRAGIQTLAWGESDIASITDEISPMDYREPLNLNLDELRVGQLMLTVDQYTPFGYWSGFFIPYPEFNRYPKKGSGYYYDPYNGSVDYQKEKQDGNFFEYGIRWKKTFGKSDISIMGASLINNDYSSRMVSPTLITQSKQRYSVAGITFNYAIDNFLVKGEAAMKSPKVYNDSSFQIVKKNNLDAYLGVDYSPNSTFTLSLEAVNYHVINWNDKIQGVPEDNYMMIISFSKLFMHDNLSVNWITMYNGPYTNFFNLFTTSYKWNDHVTLYFDFLIPISKNVNSGLNIYRDQKQVAFKIQYQF